MLVGSIIAVLAVCLLGVVCSRILLARSRLEPLQPSDELPKRLRADAEANVAHSRARRQDSFGGPSNFGGPSL